MISGTLPGVIVNWRVTDISGRILEEIKTINSTGDQITMDISKLPAGMYYLLGNSDIQSGILKFQKL